ncbi:MAG: protein kinase domain-containing protein [Bradymonadia bacterium]
MSEDSAQMTEPADPSGETVAAPSSELRPAPSVGRQCGVCGAAVPPDHAFCGACGARMPESMAGEGDDGLINRVIDNRYRILEKIGQGGMGSVFLAEHVGIGKRMAVKVVRADLRGNPELIRRFRREAMAVSRLADAHTITVFDFGLWKGLAYLVMEYLTGRDLGRVLDDEGRLEPPHALSIVKQMCASLAEAHNVGLVHRDLKPENVFLANTTGGNTFVKVLDFGLAKMMTTKDLRTDPGLFETQHGAIVGTPHYMAPEQIRGEQVDGRADIYALGALMYRMITGRLPYTAATPMDVLQGHLKGELDPFSVAAPDLRVPPHVEALVKRLMSVYPEDRPPTALAVSQAIDKVLAGHAPSWADATASSTPKATGNSPGNSTDSGERLDTPWTAQFNSMPVELMAFETSPELVGDADLLTRDDFENYERRLKRRSWVKLFALLVLMGGLGFGAWYGLLRQAPLTPTEEHEPNDSQHTASPLKLDVPLKGFLGRRQVPEHSDWDLYHLDLPAGQVHVDVNLTGVPHIDVVMELYNRDGQKMHIVNTQGPDKGESGRGLRVEGGEVWIMVRELWVDGQKPTENSTDPYTLTVTLAEGPAESP